MHTNLTGKPSMRACLAYICMQIGVDQNSAVVRFLIADANLLIGKWGTTDVGAVLRRMTFPSTIKGSLGIMIKVPVVTWR